MKWRNIKMVTAFNENQDKLLKHYKRPATKVIWMYTYTGFHANKINE